MSPDNSVVIDIIGEGKTDYDAVVPVLLRKLCDEPGNLDCNCRKFSHLEGKGYKKKFVLAKRRASLCGSAGVVAVVDSEGTTADMKKVLRKLKEARDQTLADFPMAVGVAQPCIEAWLLTDATSIRRALDLSCSPEIPDKPEELQAPQVDRNNNPKTALVKAAGATAKELSVKQKESIAQAINDLQLLRKKCPAGFGPFADEVEGRIKPLFH